ncbi:MAG: hypothetical protein AAGA37_14870 [Actinomycetota bacterium]
MSRSPLVRRALVAAAFLLLAGACGADTDPATTANADDVDDQAPAVAEPEAAQQPERVFDISGTWRDSIDGLELVQDGTSVTGEYAYGPVRGELDGTTFTGFYIREGGGFTCEEEREGSTSWGLIEWEFDDEGLTFSGSYIRCGDRSPGNWTGSLRDGPGFEPTPHGQNLPATTRYGYLEVTLDSVGWAPSASPDVMREPVEADEDALVFDVTIDNRNPEAGFSFQHGALFWAEIDGDLYPAHSRGTIEIDPGRNESVRVTVAIPDDLDPRVFRLWLQEDALDADRRTRPAFISARGDVDEPVADVVTTSFDPASPDPGCGGSYTYEEWTLSADAGFKANGAPAVDVGKLRSNGASTFGRSAAGELFLTTFAQATRDSSTCKLQVYRINPKVRVDGFLVDPVSNDARGVNDWTEAPSEDIWTFPVPDNLRSFAVENQDSTFQARAWVTVGDF